eukprot:Phypoly_transcript_04935.p1 GENE.Phypoly_transcript_04935~~Phypoly_transcript_04935.p1  ORF type:complete len:340 (+),score=31.07 Phypoly_transcript_04935:77-1096(+)
MAQYCLLCNSVSGLVLLPACNHILCKHCFLQMLENKSFACPYDRILIGNIQEYCEQHKGIDAEYFCNQCNSAVCHRCLLDAAGAHRGHKHCKRDTILEKTTYQLQGFVRDASIETKKMFDEIRATEISSTDQCSKLKDSLDLLYCCAVEPDNGTVGQKLYTSKFHQHATLVHQEGIKFLKTIDALSNCVRQLLQNLEGGVQSLAQIPIHSTLIFSTKTPHLHSNNAPVPQKKEDPALPLYVLQLKEDPKKRPSNSAIVEVPAAPVLVPPTSSSNSQKFDAKAIKEKYEKRNRKTWVLLGSEDITESTFKYHPHFPSFYHLLHCKYAIQWSGKCCETSIS